MTKQVKTAASLLASASVAATNGNSSQTNNLYISVDTFDPQGKTIGARIVDMYHFGTRKWLQDHLWWAMHNANTVECNIATDEQVAGYLQSAKQALAEKFNGTAPAEEAPAAAEELAKVAA